MTDLPILFSAPMVRGLIREVELPGTGKTQTRRILKPQPEQGFEPWQAEGGEWFLAGVESQTPLKMRFRKGDRLYVREAWSAEHLWSGTKPRDIPCGPIWYWADGEPREGDWTKPKVAIHMPRWASRLTLPVTDVRVQKLTDIDEIDAMAEGIIRHAATEEDDAEYLAVEGGDIYSNAVDAYEALWNRINGALAWKANPWVVALTFTAERRNIDA